MKKILTLAILLGFYHTTFSQNVSFCDDFESYNLNDPIAQTSSNWNSWAELMNGAIAPFTDDAQVNSTYASSGTNSLYFLGIGAGGPADIVLPFGTNTPYTSGNFEFNSNFYVTGGAYFNFQAEATPGITWSMDVVMSSTGTIDFTNGGGAVNFMSCPYNTNTWFNLWVKVDLTNNLWEVYVDSVLQGSFSNTINQIASLDLYPLGPTSTSNPSGVAHEFWVDDVCYSYDPPVLMPLNGQMLLINPIEGLAGQNRYPSVEVRNMGQNTITSFNVNIDYNGSIITETITAANLVSLASMQVDFTNPITLAPGAVPTTAYVSSINGMPIDDDPTDDTLTTLVTSVVPAAGKLVVGEEGTGTWCGWCPRGAVALNWMDHDYEGFWQGIAVHNGDPMVNTPYDLGLGMLINGYPSGLVDRGPVIDPSVFKDDFLQRIVIPPNAEIINGAKICPGLTGGDTLKISLTVGIKNNITGPWSLACALVEDSVKYIPNVSPGLASQWYQQNYYSGGTSLVDVDGTDWNQKPSNVPYYLMTYRHVARGILPGFGGGAMNNQSYLSGDSETHCFEFILEPGWDTSQISIVGMFINGSTMIDNASSISLQKALTNGSYNDAECGSCSSPPTSAINIEGIKNKTYIYPNPASNEIYITNLPKETTTIKIIDGRGKTVIETANKNRVNISMLSKGIYQIQIICKKGKINKRFVKK